MKKDRRGALLYVSFCTEHLLGARLESARHIMQEKGYIVGMNRGIWAETMHIQRQLYYLVVKGKKPVPVSVWASLYALGFRLDWFIDGTGTPLREDNGKIPKLVEEIAKRMAARRKSDASTRTVLEPTPTGAFDSKSADKFLKKMGQKNKTISIGYPTNS